MRSAPLTGSRPGWELCLLTEDCQPGMPQCGGFSELRVSAVIRPAEREREGGGVVHSDYHSPTPRPLPVHPQTRLA